MQPFYKDNSLSMKKAFLVLTAGTFLFTACKKDDNSPARETLVTGKWTVDSFTAGAYFGNQPLFEQNYLENVEACERDNMIDFVADHTLFNDEGATKCDPSDPQREQAGTWQLTNGENEITLTTGNYLGIPAGSNTLVIDELTSSRMRLRKDSAISAGGANATLSIRMYLHK
jgi:hypothetical protein